MLYWLLEAAEDNFATVKCVELLFKKASSFKPHIFFQPVTSEFI